MHLIPSECKLLISRTYVLSQVMFFMLPIVSSTLVLKCVSILSVGFLFSYYALFLWWNLKRLKSSSTTASTFFGSMHLIICGPFLVLRSDCPPPLSGPSIPWTSLSHNTSDTAGCGSLSEGRGYFLTVLGSLSSESTSGT